MIPPKRSRRRLLLSWPSKKRIAFLILILAIIGLSFCWLVFRNSSKPGLSKALVLSSNTILSSDDWQFSQVLVFLKGHDLTVTGPSLGNGIMQFKIGVTVVVIPLGKDLKGKLDTFWKVWKQYQILGKTLKKIDLRFSYPLVTY